MDYKKILKSRNLRLFILRLLCFIPDKAMLKLQYKMKFGRKLNLKEPRRFTEKLQWYKLNYRDEAMIACADKFEVRNYLEKKGYGHLLNECYGCFDKVENIDFDSLPSSFVVKDTLGGGGNTVIVVNDKSSIEEIKLKKELKSWINKPSNIKDGGREWPYYCGKKNRILIEKKIEAEGEHGLVDYKFFCFNGKMEFMYVVCDRVLGQGASFGIYDKHLNKLSVKRKGKDDISFEFKFPSNIYEMIKVAEDLSSDFPHARIDLYDEREKILFGEITFYNASGYMSYDPDEFDFEMGEKFILPPKRKLNKKNLKSKEQ